MALWFYAMMQVLRLQTALKATIHTVEFSELLKSITCRTIRECVANIEDPKFFKAIYVLLRAVFPALRALRYCDCNETTVDKIYLLSNRASQALRSSIDFLGDDTLFDSLTSPAELADLSEEMEEVFGSDDNYEEEE